MEEILSKNIFDDSVLFTLSPDYHPTDALLRMQMRRTVVKDTHNHRFFESSNDCLRQNMKRNKIFYKTNREIVKLRNEFQKKNSRNKIILKNGRIENFIQLKELAIYNGDVLEYNSIMKNVDGPFNDIDSRELMLQNDINFKLNNKVKALKYNAKSENESDVVECLHDIDEKSNYDVISIDCIPNLEGALSKDFITDDRKEDNAVVEEQENDLQQLLIMMALAPESNHIDQTVDLNEENKKSESIQTTQITPALQKDTLSPAKCPIKEELTDILNVTAIRTKYEKRQQCLAKTYTEKWKIYVKNKKTALERKRQDTLNNFFDKLAKKKSEETKLSEKCKQSARDFNTYQHRYKVQKHIIALQKAKLDEQNRLIEELKYNKIVEASKQSVDAMRDEVRKTYYEIDRQLKPKIKCLTNELKIQDIEEPSLVLHCLKVPQFLQRMEKRAREREEKHAMIRERRRQMEEERIRVKQQAEIAKAEMDKEEKMERIRELREKRKREKIEGIRKKQHAEKIRALIVMAELHYEKNLMLKYGIQPLKMLVQRKRENIEKAKLNYTYQLQKNIFLNWMWYTEDMWYERNFKAEDFHRKKMLKKTFAGLKENHHDYVLRKQVAEDYYDLYVTQLVFRKFKEGINAVKKENEVKMHNAIMYHRSNLLFKILTCWSTLPAINALQREQEAKKARWRKTVLQVVPDYKPPDD